MREALCRNPTCLNLSRQVGFLLDGVSNGNSYTIMVMWHGQSQARSGFDRQIEIVGFMSASLERGTRTGVAFLPAAQSVLRNAEW